MPIYTRGGDLGQTRLLGGAAVPKDDLRVKAYGAVDELQALLGLSRALCVHPGVAGTLQAIQQDLFTASAELAAGSPDHIPAQRLGAGDVRRLEAIIDEWVRTHGLPERFVLPGRRPDSAALHLARTVCRRCERILVTLGRQQELRPELLAYFNRMGDLLFVLAWALDVRDLIRQAVQAVLEERKGAQP